MTDVITAQPLTLPPNGGPNTLWYEQVNLGWSNVSQILITFPPGCANLVGARIEFAINPVYPIGGNSWFTFDDYTLAIDVTGQGNSGQWRFTGYNSDVYPHNLTAYFFWDYVDLASEGSSSSLVSL